MSIFDPFILLLKNEKAGRWHPIVFVADPLPGPPSAEKPERFKSKMHHTTGFAKREEAVTDIQTNLVPRVKQAFIGEPVVDTANDILWDGNGIPSMAGLRSPDGKTLTVL